MNDETKELVEDFEKYKDELDAVAKAMIQALQAITLRLERLESCTKIETPKKE